jgi:hypothetical protein
LRQPIKKAPSPINRAKKKMVMYVGLLVTLPLEVQLEQLLWPLCIPSNMLELDSLTIQRPPLAVQDNTMAYLMYGEKL